VKHAIVETPWTAKSSTKAWDTMAYNISTNYPDIFTSGISGNQASLRFQKVLAETKKRSAEAPYRCGNDDEPENDFIKACEDAYTLYSDWKALEGDKKVSAVDLKDKDKKAAEAIRRASIGTLSREDLLKLRKKDSRSTPVSNDGRSTPASSYGNQRPSFHAGKQLRQPNFHY
jgi:hypothetical protein